MLFQLEGTNIHLTGSSHASNGAVEYPPQWIKNAFAWADQYGFETQPNLATGHQLFVLPDKYSYKTLKFYKQLKSLWEKLEIVEDFHRLKFWKTNVVLAQYMYGWHQDGIENIYIRDAHQHHRQLIFLETMHENISHFDSIPVNVQMAQLRKTINQWNAGKQSMSPLDDAWLSANFKAMCSFVEADRQNDPWTYKQIIDERNRTWLPNLLNLLPEYKHVSSPKLLIAVGAIHLCGRTGLVDLLARSGVNLIELL